MRISQAVSAFTVIVLIAASLSGCWNKEAWGIRGDEFQKTFIRYSSAVRWADYAQAYQYLKKREGELKPLDLAILQEFDVTSYEIIDKTVLERIKEDPVEIDIQVVIDYTQDGSPSVKQIKRTERWWMDRETEVWYLDGDLPDFAGQA